MISQFEKILLFLFVTIFVFVTQDPNLGDQHEVTQALFDFFMKDFIHQHFSIYLFLLTAILFNLFIKYKQNFSSLKGDKGKIILIAFIIYILLLLLNPNNNPNTRLLGLPLYSEPKIFVVFLCTLFFLFIEEKRYVLYIRTLVKYFVLIYFLRVLILLFLYLLNIGVIYLGVMSVTMEEDTLILGSLVGLWFLMNFFKSNNKYYLLPWIVILIFEVLSFRRTGLLLFILVSFVYFWFFYSYNYKLKKYLVILFILFVGTMVSLNINLLPNSVLLYLHRNIGQFIQLPNAVGFASYAHNMHIEQSNYSLELMFDLPFWGFGYGKSEYKVRQNYVGNTGIHNAYYNLWEQRGLFALLFYLLLVAITIREFIVFIVNQSKYEYEYILFKGIAFVFLTLFFINAYVLMINNFTGDKMFLLLMLLISFILRININNYKVILH